MAKYSILVSWVDEALDSVIIDADALDQDSLSDALDELVEEQGVYDNELEEFDFDLDISDVRRMFLLMQVK